jgi:hypothetical protein
MVEVRDGLEIGPIDGQKRTVHFKGEPNMQKMKLTLSKDALVRTASC